MKNFFLIMSMVVFMTTSAMAQTDSGSANPVATTAVATTTASATPTPMAAPTPSATPEITDDHEDEEESEGKNYVEIRGGGKTTYFYAEYTRRLPKGFSFTGVFIKEGEAKEFSIGFGRSFSLGKALTVTPVAYATFGNHGQRGATLGSYFELEAKKVKGRAFVGRFINIRGQTESYTSMDVGDLTYAINKRWDVGISNTFFCQTGECESQHGPLVRRNDKLGAWEFSYRFGQHSSQFRLTRTFSF